MRDLVSRERIPSTQDTGRGRLKSITDAIRFTRRTSTSSKTTKVASGEFSYNDMLIVSETIRLQGCACLHWRVRAFGSSGARAFVCSCVRVLVRSCARAFVCSSVHLSFILVSSLSLCFSLPSRTYLRQLILCSTFSSDRMGNALPLLPLSLH